jgi:hypothetical protein
VIRATRLLYWLIAIIGIIFMTYGGYIDHVLLSLWGAVYIAGSFLVLTSDILEVKD